MHEVCVSSAFYSGFAIQQERLSRVHCNGLTETVSKSLGFVWNFNICILALVLADNKICFILELLSRI